MSCYRVRLKAEVQRPIEMSSNAIFVFALFVGAIVVVVVPIEIGYRLGLVAHRRAQTDKENLSVVASSILGLLAFILAFTFGIAANRFDTRIELVRNEANAIRTAWARSDFLPKTEQEETKMLLRKYLSARITAIGAVDLELVREVTIEAEEIQRRLWAIALSDASKDLNSDIGALYIQSLNEVSAIHASRVAMALQSRIPTVVWVTLASITVLGMIAVGYQFGVAGSKRTIAVPLLAIAFSLVIGLIGLLDRPILGLTASQRPLENLFSSIESEGTRQTPSLQ